MLNKINNSKTYVIAHADGIRACGTMLVYFEAQPSAGHTGEGPWAMVWDPVRKKTKSDVPLNTSAPENPQYAVFPCLAADISVWKNAQTYPDVSGNVIVQLNAGGSYHPPYTNPFWYYWTGTGHGEAHATQASDPSALEMTDAEDWIGENDGYGHSTDPGGAVTDYTMDYGYTVNGCRGHQGLDDIFDGPGTGITAVGAVNPYFEIMGGSQVIYWDKEVQAGHIRGVGYDIDLGYFGVHQKSDQIKTETIIDSFYGPWGKIFDDLAVNDYNDEYHHQFDDPLSWGVFPFYEAKSGQQTIIYRQSLRHLWSYYAGGHQCTALYSKKYMFHLEYLEYLVTTYTLVHTLDNPPPTTVYERGDTRVSIGSTLCSDTSKVSPLEMKRDTLFENAFKNFIAAIEAQAPPSPWQQSDLLIGNIYINIMGKAGD